MSAKIHQGQPLIQQGAKLEDARAAVIMIHGRGGGVESILPLTAHFTIPGVVFLAPSARDRTWYPGRFLDPRQKNEPHLSSALAAIDHAVQMVVTAGMPTAQIIILGFSQGGCLALEYAARNPRRYGGIAALSGALIGAEEELVGYIGAFKGTPILLGCSDRDEHIPLDRVYISEELLRGMGAEVDMRIYPGMGHTIIQNEVDAVRLMITRLLSNETEF